jgi:hypothetical protein
LFPPPKFLEDSIPFAKGLELVVDIPINSGRMSDIYINDLVSLAVEIKRTDNLVRSNRAPLLAFDTCACLLDPNEPIPCKTMEARDKLAAEAMLEEPKMILGWFLDFCCLRITLPDNKFKAWTSAIEKIIQEGSATAKEIEQNIGRLVHLGLALPFIHHFMSRLRDLHLTATQRRSVKVNGEYAKDLRMMLGFLKIANEDISLKSIAFRQPTHIYRSDSCPASLGGYSHKGWAWRWYLPDNLLFRASNKLLKHLAAIVLPWVDIIAGRLKRKDCVLSMTDSTTVKGWLKKTNFSEFGENPIQVLVRIEAARMQATLFLKRGLKSYSQWFKGERNEVSDALSRDNDRTENKFTLSLKTCCPSQFPSHFKIRPLPNKNNLVADCVAAAIAHE